MSTIGESICGTNAKIKLQELASSVNQIKGDFNDITYQEIVDYFNIYNNVTVHKGGFPRQNSEILENRMFKFL